VSERRPGPDASSDDTRERAPVGDGADQPAAEGTRSDHAGTSGTLAGVSPGGSAADGDAPVGQGRD
jgi:hypothetical protein